jgi:hypothetical protein
MCCVIASPSLPNGRSYHVRRTMFLIAAMFLSLCFVNCVERNIDVKFEIYYYGKQTRSLKCCVHQNALLYVALQRDEHWKHYQVCKVNKDSQYNL